MVLFVLSPGVVGSLVAAFGAGVTCLMANSATRTLLAKHAGRAKEASVMAVWAIAWAGSKPVASLADGWLAGTVGLRRTGFILALPALIPVTVLIVLMISVLVVRASGNPAAARHREVQAGAELVRTRGVLPSQRLRRSDGDRRRNATRSCGIRR